MYLLVCINYVSAEVMNNFQWKNFFSICKLLNVASITSVPKCRDACTSGLEVWYHSCIDSVQPARQLDFCSHHLYSLCAELSIIFFGVNYICTCARRLL